MKAATLSQFGAVPSYGDFPDPVPGPQEVLVQVKAVVLENVTKMMADGVHYSSKKFFPVFPAVIGHSGIGLTEDGRMVAFGGIKPPFGSFAEKVAVPETALMPIPPWIDAATAAALPPALLTSLLPLQHIAHLQPGESVLINGATGVAGKLAVQVAKLLGTGRVIGTGRNKQSLEMLLQLGADAVIDLGQSDDQVTAAFAREAGASGYDIVLDYLWGRPAELLLKTFVPKDLGFARKKIRYVHIGQKAGATVSLAGESLRTSGLEIMGLGTHQPDLLRAAFSQVWDWARDGKLHIDILQVPLSTIGAAWKVKDTKGKRVVLVP